MGRPKGEPKVHTNVYLKQKAYALIKASGINVSDLISDAAIMIFGNEKEMELRKVRDRLVNLETELVALKAREAIITAELNKKEEVLISLRAERLCDAWYLRSLLKEDKGMTGARGLMGGWDVRMEERDYSEMMKQLRNGRMSVDSSLEDFEQFRPFIRDPRKRNEIKTRLYQELLEERNLQERIQA